MDKKKVYSRELRVGGLQVREREDGGQSRIISGCAIVFNTPTTLYKDGDREVREQISPDAITYDTLMNSDIKMTMFHNRELILARSRNGSGTLLWERKEDGVWFEFEAPHTADGDKALELVRTGDLDGCSFAFTIADWEESCDRTTFAEGDTTVTLYTIRQIEAIHDFTITADPAYPTTEVAARCRELSQPERDESWRDEVARLRKLAKGRN